MIVTCRDIQRWIDEYVEHCGMSVHNRKWQGKYINGHAPYNNANNCYYEWLKIVEANIARLSTMATFEELFEEVEKLKIKGIGDLTIYDTATMIGAPNGIYPQKVYLHAGAAIGAKALGVKGAVVDKSVFVALCPAFDKLTPMQIEDFLCIFKSHLQGIPKEIKWCGICNLANQAEK